MFETIKKMMLTGVGIAIVTKERAEEMAKEMVNKGTLSEHQGKEFVEKLVKESREAHEAFDAKLDELLQKAVSKLDLVEKRDFEKLSKKVTRLETKIKGIKKEISADEK